jgi:hypothetical protein
MGVGRTWRKNQMTAQRKQINVKVDATKAQGKGAYVIFRGFTWGERKALQERFKAISQGTVDEKGVTRTLTDELELVISERIIDWNFVDNDGKPLPLPDKPGGLDCLNDAEINFMFETIQNIIKNSLGQGEEAKN